MRGRGGTAIAAAARGAPGNPPPQHGGSGTGDDARPRQELPAYAARADHRRRGARPGGVRSPPAMNTGHDGSMGTLHANSPRECLSRIESMISMGGFTQPSRTLRRDDLRLDRRDRPGDPPTRRLAPHHTHITESAGMEGEVITTQDIFSTISSARTRTARSSAAIAPRAWAARASGSGPLLRPRRPPRAALDASEVVEGA